MSIRTPLTGPNATKGGGSVPEKVDPTGRFSIRADLYRLYRPSYPNDIVKMVFEQSWPNDKDKLVVADIGSGTGISTRLLLTCDATKDRLDDKKSSLLVYGVEPNTPMRKGAEEDLVEFQLTGSAGPGKAYFDSREGSAEQTTLDDHSVDVIVAFQAGHWFKTTPTRDEFQRILRKSGSSSPNLYLVWNTRREATSPAQSKLLSLHEKHRNHDTSGAQASSSERHDKIAEALLGENGFTMKVFQHSQLFTLEAYQGFVHSISFMPPAGTPEGEELDKELAEIFGMLVEEQGKLENQGRSIEQQIVDVFFDTYVFYGAL